MSGSLREGFFAVGEPAMLPMLARRRQREVRFEVPGRLCSMRRRCPLRMSAQTEAMVDLRVVVVEVEFVMGSIFLRLKGRCHF